MGAGEAWFHYPPPNPDSPFATIDNVSPVPHPPCPSHCATISAWSNGPFFPLNTAQQLPFVVTGMY